MPPVDETGGVTYLTYRNPHYSYAVDEFDPGRLYFADELYLYESRDGGCSWTGADLFGEPPTHWDPEYSYRALVAGSAPQGPAAYLLLNHLGQPVLASADRQTGRWTMAPLLDASTGAPLAGRPLRLWDSPVDPDVLYVALGLQPDFWDGLVRLYRSDDGGRTWDLRLTNPLGPQVPGDVDASCPLGPQACAYVDPRLIQLDPLDPDKLWSASSNGVFASTDGGRSWTNVYPVTDPAFGGISWLNVVHRRGSPAQIIAFGWYATAWSTDGGETWSRRPAMSGFGSTGQKVDATIDSVAASGPGERVALLSPNWSYAGSNVQVLRRGEWKLATPPWLTCPADTDSPYAECLSRITYSTGARAYYAMQIDAGALIAFRPRP